MVAQKSKSILVLKPSQSQSKDTGMALVLICIIIGLMTGHKYWYLASVALLLADMVYSKLFFIPAIFWFSLANLLGLITSKILLTLIFFLIITPVGLIRKLLGKLQKSNSKSYDSLNLRQWKKSKESVFISRNKKFEKKDLINPY